MSAITGPIPDLDTGPQMTHEGSNPYYLHHTENPLQTLVSQLLTGDNYSSWSRAMLLALSAKNKLGFIDGSITEPQGTDQILLNLWARNNDRVVSWILNSVSKDISGSIMYPASARELWVDLKDRFLQSKGLRIFQLGRELRNLRQEQTTVSVYFTKLKTIWAELNSYRPGCTCGKCTCGGVKNINDRHQEAYVMSFLMGLDECFSQVRGQILLMNPMPPINCALSLVLQEEEQRQMAPNPVHTGPVACATRTSSFKRGGSDPIKSSNSSTLRGQRRDRPYCTHCKISGHVVERCYKLHGYPPGYKSRDNYTPAAAHRVSIHDNDLDCPTENHHARPFGGFVDNLSPTQYQQLMSLLSTHLDTPCTTLFKPR